MTMRIIHRISISSSPEIRSELARMSILVGGNGLVWFDADESGESWRKLQRWIAARRPADIVRTEFSAEEIAGAKWLELMPDWHYGYPQPKPDVSGYREATYDLSEYCEECGIGLKQKAPFQMKGGPKWGRRGILQLNWVFDEYFVTPNLWTRAFKPRGIGCRQVLNTRGTKLETVVQLAVTEEVDLITEGLQFERCGPCGRVRYLPSLRGFFPPLLHEPISYMAKTRDYFGSGASACKRVLISQELHRALV